MGQILTPQQVITFLFRQSTDPSPESVVDVSTCDSLFRSEFFFVILRLHCMNK